eukprot:7659978-Alexandrium_andersonii.AAC.1
MSASLVGSEMCIRDSPCTPPAWRSVRVRCLECSRSSCQPPSLGWLRNIVCLLYTSDAADDM